MSEALLEVMNAKIQLINVELSGLSIGDSLLLFS